MTRESHRYFWATTGFATIVAAAIGAGATLLAQRQPQPNPTIPRAYPATQANRPSPTPQEATAAPATGIYWHGTFVLDNYVDFDSAPPQNMGGSLSQDVAGSLDVNDAGGVWNAVAPPTKQKCSDQIATRAASRIPLDVGTQVCYRTRTGRIVYFKVNSIVEQGSLLANPRFEVSVVVWNP
jgi:hypothetical protein